MRKLPLAWALVPILLLRCSCLVPVSQGRPDAGSDAGASPTDAGADAGCVVAADCKGSAASVSVCSASAGYSCVEGRCLWECRGGRVCGQLGAPDCLACPPEAASASCRDPARCAYDVHGGGIEQATCTSWPGTGVPLVGSELTITETPDCTFAVDGPGGLSLGDYYLLDNGALLGDFPGFGGPCLGEELATGVPRAVFSCPACQLQLRLR